MLYNRDMGLKKWERYQAVFQKVETLAAFFFISLGLSACNDNDTVLGQNYFPTVQVSFFQIHK